MTLVSFRKCYSQQMHLFICLYECLSQVCQILDGLISVVINGNIETRTETLVLHEAPIFSRTVCSHGDERLKNSINAKTTVWSCSKLVLRPWSGVITGDVRAFSPTLSEPDTDLGP